MTTPLRQLGWRFWVTFVLACVIAEGGELLFDRFAHTDATRSGVTDSLVAASGFYQRLVTAPRHPIARFTAVVELDPAKDDVGVSDLNVCDERLFLAQLLRRIDTANPAMIVIDKYFGGTTCSPNDARSLALLDAINAVRSHRSLVVGSRVAALDHAIVGGTDDRNYVVAELNFAPDNWTLSEGILNIAKDSRRLPLQWRVAPNRDAANKGNLEVRDTLALAVAKLYDPHLLQKNPRLRRILLRGRQPFIGFLTPDQFASSHYYVSELCNGAVEHGAGTPTCHGVGPPPAALRNRIVVVGENDPTRDNFATIIGRLPGFYLQANYIEALLDDRYYAPGGPILDVGAALLFLFGLELILLVYHHDVVKAAGYTIGLAVGTGAILYLTITITSVYIDPIGVSATAVLIKLLHFGYGYAKRDPAQASEKH